MTQPPVIPEFASGRAATDGPAAAIQAPAHGREWRVWLPSLAVAALGVVGLVTMSQLPPTVARAAATEAGLVERATVGVLIFAIVMSLARFRFGFSEGWTQTTFLLIVYAARELDCHLRFTPDSTTRIRYYFEPDDPISIRIFVFVVMAAIAAIGLHWVLAYWPRFLRDLRDKRVWTRNVLGAIAICVVAQVIDKTTKVRSFGATIEEVMELSTAVLICLAVLAFPRDADCK